MNMAVLKTVRLSRREKHYLVLCAVAVALFILVQFILFPFMDARERTKRAIMYEESMLRELAVLCAEYRSLRDEARDVGRMIEKRSGDFSLFSFLEREADRAGIKPNISHMRPSETIERGPYRESSVELRLENITIAQLVDYLERVETEQYLVSVRRIAIKRTENPPGLLSVLIQFVTYA